MVLLFNNRKFIITDRMGNLNFQAEKYKNLIKQYFTKLKQNPFFPLIYIPLRKEQMKMLTCWKEAIA